MKKSGLEILLLISAIDTRYLQRHTTNGKTDTLIENGIDGLHDKSKRPHNIQPGKVTNEIEEGILDLRITKRFGCNRIRFRLKRLKEIYHSVQAPYTRY